MTQWFQAKYAGLYWHIVKHSRDDVEYNPVLKCNENWVMRSAYCGFLTSCPLAYVKQYEGNEPPGEVCPMCSDQMVILETKMADEMYTVEQAALFVAALTLTGVDAAAARIRLAIRQDELRAWMQVVDLPAGTTPVQRGLLVRKSDVQRWASGKEKEVVSDQR